jgi:hypothetical protein
MKPRRPVNLTSPAPCGAFLFPSALPCNRAAQAPPFAFTDGLPSALPLSPFGPVPPRLGQATGLCRPCRPSAAPLALPRAALCRRLRSFPFPCPVRRPAACLAKPLPPALCRHRAAPEGRQPSAAGDHRPRRCRPPAKEWRFTNPR